MRILTLTILLGLPFMALGQTEPQQPAQEQTKEMQPTEPKKEKTHVREPGKQQAKPDTATDVSKKTKVQGSTQDVNRTQAGTRSSTSQTTVNKQEFRSRHSEVFSLGRHPKEFFVQRFGASHFRLIGNTYFVFVDNCWVAVDVDGFTYTERVICAGDPGYVVVE